MRQIIIICADDFLRCLQILETLKKEQDVELVLKVTTNVSENIGYTVVDNNTFWDMVEQGKFLEYSGMHDKYYGTLHINKDKTINQIMINDVSVALDIKKMINKTITIYVLSHENIEAFKSSCDYEEVKKLDFLVVDNDLINTARKIQEIVSFIEENGMRTS